MTKRLLGLSILLLLCMPGAYADEKTEQEIRNVITDALAYTKANLRGQEGGIASEGSHEFWSSGGLMQYVPADQEPQDFVSFRNTAKHIKVITLVPGKAAMAHYYSEGSFQPKGFPEVNNYLTRVTQVFVKEDGEWKIRGAHWSPVAGGSGTKQTSLD